MPSCFVVMGFGVKTDFQQNKTFDLDKTYRNIIKPAVQAAGYVCERADEIQHAGVIDVPMYEKLLTADLVIADLSTANTNAFFELGVRYALRPRTTIVIAEKGFKIPFDMGHVVIRHYEHLGAGIDYEEVERMKGVLIDACKAVVAGGRVDSPVYTFLVDLVAPLRGQAAKAATVEPNAKAIARFTQLEQKRKTRERKALAAATSPKEKKALTKPYAALMEEALQARALEKFDKARDLLQAIRVAQGSAVDPFVLQQLALATYKSKKPNPRAALLAAHKILMALGPESSSDPETLGLWGAVHKRLWELTGGPQRERLKALDMAIWAYEKGFYLKNDYYNGINLAFLLYNRAAVRKGDEAIADRVQAKRVAQQVHGITQQVLKSGVRGESPKHKQEQTYWLEATAAEALLGSGRKAEAKAALAKAVALEPEKWMVETTRQQFDKLAALLEPAA